MHEPMIAEIHSSVGSVEKDGYLYTAFQGHFTPFEVMGIGFLAFMAPPEYRHAYAKRQRHGTRTITRLFRPETKPAGAFPVTVVRI